MAKADEAIRNYLTALSDPSALVDDELVAKLNGELESTEDPVARVELRQQILDARAPKPDALEGGFVKHAKDWADKAGISAEAFLAEGVDKAVLRKAGFSVSGGRRSSSSARRAPGKRVTSDEVRSAIPKGEFTVKDLREKSGASPAVVRKVIAEEVESGKVTDVGPDPNHDGPGRAPTLYKRK